MKEINAFYDKPNTQNKFDAKEHTILSSRSIRFNTDIKDKGDGVITEYILVGTTQMNGYTVRNFAPVMSDDERKKVINDMTIKLLNEYNKLEKDKLKPAI